MGDPVSDTDAARVGVQARVLGAVLDTLTPPPVPENVRQAVCDTPPLVEMTASQGGLGDAAAPSLGATSVALATETARQAFVFGLWSPRALQAAAERLLAECVTTPLGEITATPTAAGPAALAAEAAPPNCSFAPWSPRALRPAAERLAAARTMAGADDIEDCP